MVRKHLIKQGVLAEPDFTWRGGDVSRIEALSDAVFAFSLTLIVVSLDVPQSFEDFRVMMTGFVGFAFSFALLMLIWHGHYIFFRRYGMEDAVTIALNSVLLFLILFYVYPLKFLSSLLAVSYLGIGGRVGFSDLSFGEIRLFMVTYSAGVLAVFVVLSLMYVHALRRRDVLGLDERERFDTVTQIQHYSIYWIWAALSILLALSGGRPGPALAGVIYAFIGIPFWLHGALRDRRRRRLWPPGDPDVVPAPEDR